MALARSSARGDDGLGREVRAIKSDIAQVRRLMSNIKIPKAAEPTVGFSVLGVAEVTSLASSMKHGTQGLDVTAVEFEAPWSLGTPSDLPLAPADFVSVSGPSIYLDAGWYQATVRLDVGGPPADMPDFAQVATVNQVGDGGTAPWAGYDETLVAVTGEFGARGWNAMLSRPLLYIEDGDWIQLEVHYTHTAAVGSACLGLNGDPGIHWTFVKLT